MKTALGSLAADAWGRRFLEYLGDGLGSSDSREIHAFRRRVADAAREIIAGRDSRPADGRSRTIIGLCSIVLAGYRETLAAIGDDEKSFDVTAKAFARTYQGPARMAFRGWLRIVRDPVRALTRMSMAGFCRTMYGPTMGFEQEAGEGHVDLIVTRCAYHRFFAEAGEPRLTRVFCRWDRNWMDVLDASARPIHTERPSTLAAGGDCCRFRFVRSGPGAPGPKVDVALGEICGLRRPD